MLAGKNPLQPHQEEFVKWVYDTIPHNDNWRVWLTRHYKNKPEDFTPEIKSTIQHYADMARGAPEVEKVRFDKTHDLHTGLSMLENAEKEYQQKRLDKERKVVPTDKTKMFNPAATPNRAWFHLGARFDAGEKRAMGHCAKCSSEDAKLLSLRDIVQENGKTYHIPHITASVYEFPDGSFYIGQMKERFNEKPNPAYHKDIMELLKNPKMVGLVGIEYNPKEDFKFEDLTPEQQQEVLKHNPNFIKNDEEAKIKGQEIAEEIKKDISKIKKITHGHISLFKDQIQKSLENHPNLLDDPEIAQKVYDSGLKSILAAHPNLFTKAPYLVEKLANDEDWYIRLQIALNPYLLDKAPYLVEKLANDKYWLVRRAISEHPNLFTKFPHLVEKFANDENKDIRIEISQNPNLFDLPNVAEKLVNDENLDVRLQIAKKPNLFTKAPHLVEKLANDKNFRVRMIIANKPMLGDYPEIAKKLLNDKSSLVRYAAKNSLENKYQKYKQLRFKFRKMKKFEKLTINRYLRLLKYRF